MRRIFLTLIVSLVMSSTHVAELAAQTARPTRYPPAENAPQLTPRQANPERNAERNAVGMTAATVVGALALVLAIFFVGAWMFRRAAPAGFGVLPAEAFEPLGRARLTARHNVHLLRCGNKVLLVAVGATGAETLAEIDDPREVARLVELCRRPKGGPR
ncbi:MAG: FliO/MopB family protein [Pirellulales bacterium]|nr:FliO/MopB family protein [Pirellulales bacterium]